MRVGYYFAFEFETSEPVVVPGHAGRGEVDFLMIREGRPDHVSGWSHGRVGSTPMSYPMSSRPAMEAVAGLFPAVKARAAAELLVRALVALGRKPEEAVENAKVLLEAEELGDEMVTAALDEMEAA